MPPHPPARSRFSRIHLFEKIEPVPSDSEGIVSRDRRIEGSRGCGKVLFVVNTKWQVGLIKREKLVMKNLYVKFFVLVAVLINIGIAASADTKVSQTFFKARTISESPVIPFALGNFQMHHNKYERPYSHPEHWSMMGWQSTYFYQESFKGRDLARYFLFGEKTTLNVKEDGTGDIASDWLDLRAPHEANNFDSKFTIYPKRKVYGSVVKYHRDLSKHIDGLWFNITLPLVRVEQDIRIKEFNKNKLGGGESTDDSLTPTTIIGALNHGDWKYGKFNTKKLHETGVDDGLVNVGYTIWAHDRSHIKIYGSLLAPTGNQPKAEYIFEPLIGNGRHIGIGFGTNFDAPLLFGRKRYIHLLGDIHSEYLFAGTEKRSFDLKNNGPWSRYLFVAKEGSPAEPLPGINFFTRDMKVTPRWNFNAILALHGEFSNFNVELGYNLWCKSKEKVRLRHLWDENVEQIGIAEPGGTYTVSTAKINHSFNNIDNGTATTIDTSFVKITQSDLDLNSATHKSTSSHTVYVSLSRNSKFLD